VSWWLCLWLSMCFRWFGGFGRCLLVGLGLADLNAGAVFVGARGCYSSGLLGMGPFSRLDRFWCVFPGQMGPIGLRSQSLVPGNAFCVRWNGCSVNTGILCAYLNRSLRSTLHIRTRDAFHVCRGL
jgi:hypothetical protein